MPALKRGPRFWPTMENPKPSGSSVVARFVENARRWTSGEPLIGEIDKQAGHS